jgi:aldehyde reductase
MSANVPFVTFYNGNKMPVIGLGSWAAPNEEVENALKIAIDLGYRNIDTAFTYRNQKGVGNAIKAKIQEGVIKREDIFVTTKLPGIGLRREDVEFFLKRSLADLQLNYVDLYLVHTPFAFKRPENLDDVFPRDENGKFKVDNTTKLEEAWKGMEAMVDSGLTKSIGLSNFNSQQIQRILNIARIKPANLQVECHVYFQQKKLRELCRSNGITVCAYGPIGSPARSAVLKARNMPTVDHPQLLEDPVVRNIAKKHNKTPAQVFDFELDPADMKTLRDSDRGVRYFDMKIGKEVMDHPEFPFKIPF